MTEPDDGHPHPVADAPDGLPAAAGAGQAARHHYQLAPLPWLAGCSDVGQRHQDNQDALALSGRDDPAGQVAVLAVSDGVSTSFGSERSASIAVDVACSTLVSLLRRDPQATQAQVEATLEDAFAAAHDAILVAGQGEEPAGSCTLVTAVVWQRLAVVGNLGDCRAYFVGEDGSAALLSVDDSVAQARIDMGLSREEAENGPQAHAITRWLGPDAADVVPRRIVTELDRDGWLLVCSDGLWNYCSPVEQMSALVLEAAAQCGQDVGATSRMLVDWANAQGGRDNITVALMRVTASQA